MRRVGQVATGASAALVVFGAVPAALVIVVGLPVPRHDGHLDLASARALYDALAVVAWVAWATGCVALIRAVAALVRDPRALAGAPGSLQHRLAAAMAASVLAATSLSAAPAGAGLPPLAAPRSSAAGAVAPPVPSRRAVPSEDRSADALTVRDGDSLWHMAERTYDDGGLWPVLADANRDRPMPDGNRFVDPNQIRTGWTLRRPDGAVDRRIPGPSRAGATAPGPSPGVPLPELVAVGLSTVVASALARHLRRRQLLARSARLGSPGAPEVPSAPLDLPVDVATLVHPFADATALDWLTWANRRLAHLMTDDQWATLPRLVRIGPAGLELHFAEATPTAPPGVIADADGRRWRLAFDGPGVPDDTIDPGPVWLPLLVPLGDDDLGTWLAVAAPGRCVAVLGRGAPALVAAMRAALAAWPWAEQISVTDEAPTIDPATAGLRAAGALGTPQHLFIGDPGQLSAGALDRCGVVAPAWSARADLTVVVDERATTVHPLGLVLRPSGVAAAAAGDAERLTDAPAAVGPRRPVERHRGSTGVAPGAVRVRLLVAQPRLEGLAEALPANRERRATELVAYLALHRPEPVSSDRLRTRVFGSGESDAAAKTLFNIAAAARRALGTDDAGEPLLPAALRSCYRLSEAVTVDVEDVDVLVRQGLAARDDGRPEVAMASLRAALDLVDAEPLSAVVAGYGWFAAEGHEGRLAARLVEGACQLAELGGASGHRDLAEWGLHQARRVEPYSEALSRAAMRLAAAVGDGDGVRREWRECQRRADELDPGSTPSAGTERLYAELIVLSTARSA